MTAVEPVKPLNDVYKLTIIDHQRSAPDYIRALQGLDKNNKMSNEDAALLAETIIFSPDKNTRSLMIRIAAKLNPKNNLQTVVQIIEIGLFSRVTDLSSDVRATLADVLPEMYKWTYRNQHAQLVNQRTCLKSVSMLVCDRDEIVRRSASKAFRMMFPYLYSNNPVDVNYIKNQVENVAATSSQKSDEMSQTVEITV